MVSAQIVITFHNYRPSIRTKNVDPLQAVVSTVHKAQTSVYLCQRNPTYLACGRKPLAWAKFHAKRGNYQGVTSTICVEEDLRFISTTCRIVLRVGYPLKAGQLSVGHVR